MSAKIVTFKITGLTPLLMHNPAAMLNKSDAGPGVKRIPTPEEEAERGLYRTADGQLYIPSGAFRSAIIGKGGSASGRKIGKFSANSRVAAGMFVVEERTLLIHAKTGKPLTDHDYEIDVRRAVIQGNGVLRARPKISDWSCLLALEIDEDFVTIDQVALLLNIAGKASGVLDYRPQCKGTFGRFVAELVQDEPAKPAGAKKR